ncbi:hypothetical protein [Thalassolituus alkanivorans]|uniref:hypothetical protein n=1 Tax=Thalassolituus alkanivorans TaxID=2881055 RepID=UPI001E3A7FE9|nr:hypothetical protein [Thalassolituus alkanivorans]MCB2386470.1 hypothetical protein [Thalassolituus alkanivorans]MCB2424386.1 hypothetical protein [Thalassolituus alkanivorans]
MLHHPVPRQPGGTTSETFSTSGYKADNHSLNAIKATIRSGMNMLTPNTYIALEAAGIPSGSVMADLIRSSGSDSSKVSKVFYDFNAITSMFGFAAVSEISWFYSETTSGEFPVAFLMEGIGDNSNSVVLTLLFNQNVLDGIQAAPVFEDNQQSYYQVATVSMVVRLAGQDVYTMLAKIGVGLNELNTEQFTEVDWQSTLSSVLPRLVEGINQLYIPPGVSSDDPAIPAIHPGLWLACQVSTPVNIALTIIKLAELGVTIVKHPSAFQWLIANFSSSTLTISDSYQYEAGLTSCSDTSGHPVSTPVDLIIQPPQTVNLPYDRSIELVQFAVITQICASELKGTGVALITQSDLTKSSASLINIPWSGDNKVHVSTSYPQTAADYWDQQSDISSGNSQSAIFTDGTTLDISIDALSGRQPMGDGKLAYYYNAILAFNQ